MPIRLLGLLAASILPAMAALLYVQLGLRHERSERVADSALHQARLLSADMETLVDGARQLTLAIAQFHSTRALNGGCSGQLTSLRQALASYALLEVATADGTVICAAGNLAGLDQRGMIGPAASARRFTVGTYMRTASGAGLLPMVQPFTADDGHPAVVVAAIDAGWLQQHLLRFRLVVSNSLTVADRTGTILARLPQPQRWQGRKVVAGALALVTAGTPGTRALTGIDGVKRIVGYVPAAATGGLYVAYGVYVPDLLRSIDQAAQRGYVLIAVGAVLSLLLMLVITRRLIHVPTEALLDAAQRWSLGDLAARAVPHVSADNEFGRLAAAFNYMAESLDARRRQLQELNASLEGRVGERTRALSETNNRLLVEISERERTDEALRQSQRAQAVGHLAGGMAHEFNNLLTTIMGGLELLKRRLRDPAVQDQAARPDLVRYVDPALEAAQRGARLTSQLLAFARRRRLLPVAVDLNTVLTEMQDLLQGAVGRGVDLRLDLAADLRPALADREEIEAAILNLVLNARDALKQGGTLRVATCNADPSPGAAQAAGMVKLLVADDGVGMTEDELSRSIDPFYTTKPLGQGAGLGLSQVHGLALQLGGDLHIQSVKGRGTTVCLTLPRADAAAEPPAAPPRPAAGGSLLLVDDDDDVRDVAAEMLTELGYGVVQASGGDQALALLTQHGTDHPFAGMIADYAMPGMTGLELIREVRRRRPALGVLLITGYMELNEASADDRLQPNQVLRKPFTMTDLACRVAEITGHAVVAEA